MGGYRVVFVTVDESRVRLENLTKLLVRTFPSSVIYQYTDPGFAVIHMDNRRIDTVFVHINVLQKNDWKLLALLRRKKSNLQVFVLAEGEQFRETALQRGAWEYLVRPVTGQKLRETIYSMTEESAGLF